MTPKEKCNELIVKIMSIELADDRIPKITFNQAKECALIAVDEILKSLPPFEYGLEFVAKIEFWNNVKKEIKAL